MITIGHLKTPQPVQWYTSNHPFVYMISSTETSVQLHFISYNRKLFSKLLTFFKVIIITEYHFPEHPHKVDLFTLTMAFLNIPTQSICSHFSGWYLHLKDIPLSDQDWRPLFAFRMSKFFFQMAQDGSSATDKPTTDKKDDSVIIIHNGYTN